MIFFNSLKISFPFQIKKKIKSFERLKIVNFDKKKRKSEKFLRDRKMDSGFGLRDLKLIRHDKFYKKYINF